MSLSIAKRIAAFRTTLHQLSFREPSQSELTSFLDLLAEQEEDRTTMCRDDFLTKWNPRFNDYLLAVTSAMPVVDAVLDLQCQPEHRLRSYLKRAFGDSVAQNFVPAQNKDHLYELVLGSMFARAGFDVDFNEPDIRVSGGSLSSPLAVACKYLSSESNIAEHISKGCNQIKQQNMNGFVALGIDLIAFRELQNCQVDFRASRSNAREVLQRLADNVAVGIMRDRRTDYPDEPMPQGLLVTVAAGGVYGDPPAIALLHALSFAAASSSSQIYDDLVTITRGIKGLSS